MIGPLSDISGPVEGLGNYMGLAKLRELPAKRARSNFAWGCGRSRTAGQGTSGNVSPWVSPATSADRLFFV